MTKAENMAEAIAHGTKSYAEAERVTEAQSMEKRKQVKRVNEKHQNFQSTRHT